MIKIKNYITRYKKTKILNKKNLYIVIHYTAGTGSAKNNCIYYSRKSSRDASAHYFVDDTSIYRCVEDSYGAWHVGANKYYHPCRNSNSIGIEMVCHKTKSGGLYVSTETIKNTKDLVCSLMKKYKIDVSHVIRHYDVTHKSCPNCNSLLDDQVWDLFRNEICGVTKKYDTGLYHITVNSLNIRKEPDASSKKVGCITDGGVYTIVKTKGSWGYLKSEIGWIQLYYAKKIEKR